jgi:predicted O-linked N-acetylglucosamine transferase (SPINDLY family)
MSNTNQDSNPSPAPSCSGPTEEKMNQAFSLFQTGALAEAEVLLTEMTQCFPDHPFAWKGLSVILHQTGRQAEALDPMFEVIRLSPDDAESLNNLGATLDDVGRHKEAEEYLRKAINLIPGFAQAHFNLGNTLRGLGRLHESVQCFQDAIRFKPDFVDALCNLGVVYKELLLLDDSEASLRECMRLAPEYPGAHFNLGNTLRDLGRLEASEQSYLEAIRLRPEHSEAFCNLGVVQRDLGRYEDAESSLRAAIRSCLVNAEAYSNLGVLLNELGRFDEAELSFRESIRIQPETFELRSNLLYLLSSLKENSGSAYLDEAKSFGELLSKEADERPTHSPLLIQPQRLRVGLVSGDFRKHPVGFFIDDFCKAIDASRIELVAFPTNLLLDDLTTRLVPNFSAWQPIYGLPDNKAAELIESMGVNILIDLSGHTEHNRLGVFAHKPAPIQLTWLGYWASTGVSEIDYILGDPFVTPEGDDEHFVEKVWRLPETRFCYSLPDEAVELTQPALITNDYVTFGCFNKLNKMTPDVVSVWSKILSQLPTSRLFLKAKQLDDSAIREGVLAQFEKHCISKERLILEGATSRRDYLAAFNRTDIALDPFPFTGGATSADALWMGVPVLTKKGQSLIGRQGEGIARNSGQGEWIASDDEDYVAKAVAFATDRTALIRIKQGLREQVIQSPLFNTPRFARYFEDGLWSIWNTHAAR